MSNFITCPTLAVIVNNFNKSPFTSEAMASNAIGFKVKISSCDVEDETAFVGARAPAGAKLLITNAPWSECQTQFISNGLAKISLEAEDFNKVQDFKAFKELKEAGFTYVATLKGSNITRVMMLKTVTEYDSKFYVIAGVDAFPELKEEA